MLEEAQFQTHEAQKDWLPRANLPSIRQFVEMAEDSYSISLSRIKKWMDGEFHRRRNENGEIRLRMEKEIEDTEFRLKRGSYMGLFDQFWDDDTLFDCRYSRSKWLYLYLQYDGVTGSSPPLGIYLHALKRNRNITHITYDRSQDRSDDVHWFQTIICNLPWVTSTSIRYPADFHRDPLFVKSTNNDLITYAKEIRLKLDPFSTYIFTDPNMLHSEILGYNARVLISFVAPNIGPKSYTEPQTFRDSERRWASRSHSRINHNPT